MTSDRSHADGSVDADKAESAYRESNERIQKVNAQRALAELPEELLCECGKAGCSEVIAISALEYQGLRERNIWFLIAPSDEHFFPEAERIVVKNGHYWLVEKHDGAVLIAEQLDPRSP
jgi:hypothetical protein